MNPARILARVSCVPVAATVLLAACTGSDGGSSSTAPGSPAGGGPTPIGSAATSTSTATSTAARTTGAGSAAASPTPVRTTIRQGLHATYTLTIWAQESATGCTSNAHGTRVVAYLRAHACRRVERYLATTTANGRTVGISGSTVTFGGATATAGQSAAGFAALASDPTKGGIDDLFGDGKRLPGGPTQLPMTHVTNARNDGATVAVVDAWYLSGRTSADDPALSELLEAIT